MLYNNLLPFAILISFLATTTLSAQDNSSWTNYETQEFAISFPTDWELNKEAQLGTSLILFSQLSSEDDKFRENVNLIIQDLTGYNLDLKGFTDLSIGQLETMITDYELIESKRFDNKKISYHKIHYNGRQGQFDLTFEQYCWVVKGKAYILTFTSEEPEFKAYQATGEKILNSFVIR